MTKIYNSILDTIGDTPIVKLRNLPSEDMAQVYVKVESFNPGGSVKDRIALRMIEDAEKSGKLIRQIQKYMKKQRRKRL